MDKDNQPTPNKTTYKVPDEQMLAGDQGRMVDKGQQSAETERTVVKPAEIDEQFAQKLEDNIEEIKIVDEAGRQVQDNLAKQAPISEEEAKWLLQEEKRLAEIEYKSAQGKNKKTMIVVLVVAAVLCLLGGAFAIVMANRGDDGEKKDDQGGVSVDEGDKEQVGDNSPSGDNAQVPDEVTELPLDNALVQRLYSNFSEVGKAYSATLDFYTDEGVRKGDLSKTLMADIALPVAIANEYKYCKGDYGQTEDGRYFAYTMGCYSGENVRQKIKEIFAKAVTFNDGDTTGDYCGHWQYNAKEDEFYIPTAGCGGQCLYSLTRELNRAEKIQDKIYLYETAYGETCQTLYHTNGDEIVSAEFDDNGHCVSRYNIDDYRNELDRFKWTFTKNNDGEYIFSGLEKVEE